mgnify:CR=1 FL=1
MTPHDTHIQVPYADVDRMGFVYYANYLVYFEMARSQLLRDWGLPYTKLEREGVLLPVLEAHVDYRRPAHYEDELIVRTVACRFEGARLRIEYEVRRGDEHLAGGHTVHACMTPEGRPRRPPASLKALMDPPSPAPG